MKKKLISLLIVFLLFPSTVHAKELDTYTPFDVESDLSYLSYDKDRPPSCIAQHTEETLERGGQCLDFAYLTATMLQETDATEVQVVEYRTSKTTAHVVTIFFYDGAWWKFDNTDLRGPYRSKSGTTPGNRETHYLPVQRNMCVIRLK